MRNFLIEQLYTLKIKNSLKIIEYVDFCLEKSTAEKIKFKTSFHHILPKAKNLPFQEFENLNDFPWNGVHLLHKDHYFAHYLLFEAIDEYSVTKSFYGMHNKDIILGKINQDDLINMDEFQNVYVDHCIKNSERLKTIEENGLSIAQNGALNRNREYYGDASQMRTIEAVEKRMKTLSTIDKETGLSLEHLMGLKMSENRRDYNAENNPFYGCKHSEETKQKMSKPRTTTENMKWSEENKQKMSELLKERKVSEETKQKLSKNWNKRLDIMCPFCGLVSKNSGNMNRYHFENCKNFLN